MILTDEQRAQFESAARPLMQWLGENVHPRVTVIVDSTRAELLEGICTANEPDESKEKQ